MTCGQEAAPILRPVQDSSSIQINSIFGYSLVCEHRSVLDLFVFLPELETLLES